VEVVFLLGMFSVAMLALGSRNMPGLLPELHGSVSCPFTAGWWRGSARQAEGEFFRADITNAQFQ